jgi:hypothetical protein
LSAARSYSDPSRRQEGVCGLVFGVRVGGAGAGGWVGSEAGLRRSLRRISLVDNTRRCVAALHGYGSPLCPRGGKLHRRCTHDMRGWEPGRQERLPPGYRIDTTDAAIGVLRGCLRSLNSLLGPASQGYTRAFSQPFLAVFPPQRSSPWSPTLTLLRHPLRAPVIAVEPSNGSRSARRTLENLSPTLQRAPGPSPRSAPLGCAPQLAAGAP